MDAIFFLSSNEKQMAADDWIVPAVSIHVARIESEEDGFWLINFFGEKRFVEGVIEAVDFMYNHTVIFENRLSPDFEKA